MVELKIRDFTCFSRFAEDLMRGTVGECDMCQLGGIGGCWKGG